MFWWSFGIGGGLRPEKSCDCASGDGGRYNGTLEVVSTFQISTRNIIILTCRSNGLKAMINSQRVAKGLAGKLHRRRVDVEGRSS